VAPTPELSEPVVRERVLAERIRAHVTLPQALVRRHGAPRLAHLRDARQRRGRQELQEDGQRLFAVWGLSV